MLVVCLGIVEMLAIVWPVLLSISFFCFHASNNNNNENSDEQNTKNNNKSINMEDSDTQECQE